MVVGMTPVEPTPGTPLDILPTWGPDRVVYRSFNPTSPGLRSVSVTSRGGPQLKIVQGVRPVYLGSPFLSIHECQCQSSVT